MESSFATRHAWELAALLHALNEPDLPAAWLDALTEWSGDRVRLALNELSRLHLIHVRHRRIRLMPWSEAFTQAMRQAVLRMDADEAGRGMFAFFRLRAEGRNLDALDTLSDLAQRLVEQGRRRELRLVYRHFLRAMRRVSLRRATDADAGRYSELCRDAFHMGLCVSVECRSLLTVLFRGRALALIHGDAPGARLHELRIGCCNILDQSRHNERRFHRLMDRAYHALEEREEYLQERHALLLGAYFFMEGKFQRAIDSLTRFSPETPAWSGVHVRAHQGVLAGLAAFFLGDRDRALFLLRRALRALPHPGYPGLVRTIRAMQAMILIERKESDAALELLDVALTGVERQWDLRGWLRVMYALARYHASLPGRLPVARTILCRAVSTALDAGYRRPLYLFPATLELLDALDEAGLPPVPGYDLEEELRRCLTGPNRLLRGAALRVAGKRLLRSGRAGDALDHHTRSLDLLRGIRAYDEAAKTRLALAQYHLRLHDRGRALSYAAVARLRVDTNDWPPELADLLPALPPAADAVPAEHAASEVELLGSYLDPLPRDGRDPAAFFQALVDISCRALGMESGCLFRRAEPGNEPAVVARRGPDTFLDTQTLDLVRLALGGSPVLAAAPPGPGGAPERSVVCVPLWRADEPFVLYHEGALPAWSAELLRESLLARIGRSLSTEMALALRVPTGTQSGGPSSSGTGEGFPSPADAIVFCGQGMRHVLHLADLAAETDAPVLISGESGVGKELVARRIHERSGRTGPFVPVNLAGIPDDLLENELAGHERGAFTGAHGSKPGLLELADKGTLFLDELAEASPRVQIKLLRLLQERSFLRLGGTRAVHSDFRLVTATNADLAAAVRAGRFREDLYYRVRVIALTVPPLRERTEDILPIARHYLIHFQNRYRRAGPADFRPGEAARLLAHTWPGNVRELKNAVEHFVALRGDPSCLPAPQPRSGPTERPAPGEAPDARTLAADWRAMLRAAAARSDAPALDALQEVYIRAVVRRCGGRIDGPEGAAAALGLGRSTLYEKLRRMRRRIE